MSELSRESPCSTADSSGSPAPATLDVPADCTLEPLKGPHLVDEMPPESSLHHQSDACEDPSGSPSAEILDASADERGDERPPASPRDACEDPTQANASPSEAVLTERSNWGLFQRSSSIVREGANAYRSLVYQCTPSQTVEFRQPMEGAGTTLMHGDFARKLSPSEEAMATYILKHKGIFKGKRVMDVGAGLGFAGILVAVCMNAKFLELNDGDPEVVKTLQTSVNLNLANFGNTKVQVRKVLWDRQEEFSERGSIDLVIAADVVYLDFLHAPLLHMISRVLRPGGTFLLFASPRQGSLDKFVQSARSLFATVETTTDYDQDVIKAIGKTKKCFPVMVRIVSAVIEQELPESVTQLSEDLRLKRLLEEKEAAKDDKRQKNEEARHRARSQSLVDHRKKRLEEAFDAEEEERLAGEAAAAAAARQPQPKHVPKPKVTHEHLENRSDWGLFPRHCTQSSDGAFKDMVYEIGGQSISIRRPSCIGVGDGRKVSPSEEVLAMWALKRRKHLKKKRVLELGAGCGLAGLTVAMCTAANHVVVTDGDSGVLATIEGNVETNRDAFSAKKVSARQLLWGEAPDALKPFDYILAADILDHGDAFALVKALRVLLKPSGTIVMFASQGSTSLDAFVAAAKPVFDQMEVTRHYDVDVTQAFHGMACFPIKVRLKRSEPRSHDGQVRPSARIDACLVPSGQPVPLVTVDLLFDYACTDHAQQDAEAIAEAAKRKRQILAARHRRRSDSKNQISLLAIDSPELGAAAEGYTNEEDDVAVADGLLSQPLPPMVDSRSSSVRSKESLRLIQELSPKLSGMDAVGGLSTSVFLATRPPELPSFSKSSAAPSKPGLPPAAPYAAAAAPNFWARLPHGRALLDQAAAPARSKSVPPPAANGMAPDCLLGLFVGGNAMALQHGAAKAPRVKVRSARGHSREPPRIPVACH